LSEKPPSSLKIFDLPFAYGLVALLSSYLQEMTNPFSLENLGFIAIAGSVTVSFLALYKPVERHLIPLLVLRVFKGKQILSRGTEKTLHDAYVRKKSFPIELYGNAKEALFANPLDRTRGILTNTVHTIILLALFCVSIIVNPPNLFFQNLPLGSRIIASIILMIILALLLYSFTLEIQKTPSKVFVETIYLLVAEGVIEAGRNFSNIENALNKNDWRSTYYWTMRMEREDKYGGLFLNDFMHTSIEIKIEKARDQIRKKRKKPVKR